MTEWQRLSKKYFENAIKIFPACDIIRAWEIFLSVKGEFLMAFNEEQFKEIIA